MPKLSTVFANRRLDQNIDCRVLFTPSAIEIEDLTFSIIGNRLFIYRGDSKLFEINCNSNTPTAIAGDEKKITIEFDGVTVYCYCEVKNDD